VPYRHELERYVTTHDEPTVTISALVYADLVRDAEAHRRNLERKRESEARRQARLRARRKAEQ